MWPNSYEFSYGLLKGNRMLRRRLCSRLGRIATTMVVAAAFLFAICGRQSSLNAADDAKTAGGNPAARVANAKTVAASSTPSAPLPRVQKKVSDFGVAEVAL